MKTWKATLILGVMCLGLWAMISGQMHAQTEPVPPAPQAAQTAPQTPTAEQEATAIVGQAVQGFLVYGRTTDAERKLIIDSYNTVKAAMERLAALEKPATEGDKK